MHVWERGARSLHLPTMLSQNTSRFVPWTFRTQAFCTQAEVVLYPILDDLYPNLPYPRRFVPFYLDVLYPDFYSLDVLYLPLLLSRILIIIVLICFRSEK